ncbi:MAG: protein TolR [Chromatiales bacterium]|jgi:biopolymer transport protein TolR|nr:protein TolR [Chromatiales bacterium]
MPGPAQRTRTRRRPMSEINVVPYIDVMLVLLVIFMVTAPMLTQGVHVDLPEANAQPMEQTDSEPLILSVDDAGQFFLNIGEDPMESLDSTMLMARVQAQLRLEPGKKVLVRGDSNVSYGKVVAAMALLQRAGARGVGLATNSPSK